MGFRAGGDCVELRSTPHLRKSQVWNSTPENLDITNRKKCLSPSPHPVSVTPYLGKICSAGPDGLIEQCDRHSKHCSDMNVKFGRFVYMFQSTKRYMRSSKKTIPETSNEYTETYGYCDIN